MKEFLEQNQIKPLFIEPGAPWQNGYSESFNSRFRDELLNQELIYDVREAKVLVEEHRVFYNEERLHGALGDLTPAAFAKDWFQRQKEKKEEQANVTCRRKKTYKVKW